MFDEEETPVSEKEGKSIEQEAPVATEATDVSKPEKATSEFKVVIILKDNKAMLGVQSPDCDPVYKTMEGDLAAILQVVPALVAGARLQWAAAPRYPQADLPKPMAPVTNTTSPDARKPAAKAGPAQPKFF